MKEPAVPRNRRPGARRPRDQFRLMLIFAIVGILALAGGYLLGAGRDGAKPSGSPAASLKPSGSPEPTASATGTQTDTQTPEPTEEPGAADIEDGKHFARVKQVIVTETGPMEVEFDLAYFLTGQEAIEAAQEHDDEVTNGYYVVNDNPKLRRVPLAPDASVSYVPDTVCCDLQPGDLQAWVDSTNGTVMSDYPDPEVSWWWLTVEGGQIVAVEHQWVP